ncbi:acyloxyacyl hydrolase [Edaphobacter aggregans]|uniref:acyloxyacyl hydrolase n=1 Tax=Edaphobacter aggregans TaxID=570835 RepID=UPI000556BBD3|nr:acyloxyacyl hydrolase [Edaphobacter aggregans]
MIPLRLLALFLLGISAELSHAQESHPYSFRQSFSAFSEYSNTSSHIFLGVAQNRRLVALGMTYSRRLLHSRYADWNYAPELLPLVFIQDPVDNYTIVSSSSTGTFSAPTAAACRPSRIVFPSDPANHFSGVVIDRTCGARWTYAGGLSPLGQRINLAPRHRLQPFVAFNAGFLVSPGDVPVNDSSRFNFTFEFGAGIELFHDRHHSWSAEYKLHHLSNAWTGKQNPGVDNQVIRLSYTLGR